MQRGSPLLGQFGEQDLICLVSCYFLGGTALGITLLLFAKYLFLFSPYLVMYYLDNAVHYTLMIWYVEVNLKV